MNLNIRTTETYQVLEVEGDVDASSSLELDNHFETLLRKSKHILVDCTALNYISSPGIGVFTSRLQESEDKNVKIVIFGLNEKVFKVFRILGLDALIAIVPTLEDAKKEIH